MIRNDRRTLRIMIFRRLGRRRVGIGLPLRVRMLWIKSIRVCEAVGSGFGYLVCKSVGYTWLIAGGIVDAM